MTLYLLFAGTGTLIFIGVALAEAAISGFSGAGLAFGPRFAFFASLSIILAAVILFYPSWRVRARSSSVNRASAWRRHIVTAAVVFFASGIAILIAATGEPGEASVPPSGPHVAVVDDEVTRAGAAGRTVFQERGCAGCHRSDGTGAGPTLHGLLGSQVEYPASAVATVDESYLREAILNPLATVRMGYLPIMPTTFAGQLTEEELQALIVYLKSLSAPVQVQGR